MGTYSIDKGYRKTRRKTRLYVAVHVVALFGLLGAGIWHFNLPEANKNVDHANALVSTNEPIPTIDTPMPWPSYGHSAYGAENGQVVATSSEEAKAVPIASLAKVITALAILKEKPLAPGEQGPTITLSERDVALYNEYLSKEGAVTLVVPGEQISQYQALQAMLMPSANNIADSLAIWAFGSVEAYVEYANKMVREMGLVNTVVDDASGFSPLTISTPAEMVELGSAYMQQPVLKQIAMQPQANIPVAGTIINYNSLINKEGLIGIKVGYTDEAGRCFMLANVRGKGSKETVSLTVVLGAEHLDMAMKDAQAIIAAGDAGYDQTLQNR